MLRNSVIVLGLLVGCEDVHKDQRSVKDVPLLVQRYAEKPEPGTMVALPPVPLVQSSGGADAQNLLSNPGFEDRQEYWEVSGSDTAACTRTHLLCTDGRFCFQVQPSATGHVFVSQAVTVNPRRFYSFSVFLFAPAASEAALEVRDMAGKTLLRGEALSGPMSAWSHVCLNFVTGNRTEGVEVGVYCSSIAEDNPILIDQSALYALPTENFLSSGTMETAPEEGRMPEWYSRGKSVSPASEGYQSKYSLELPPCDDRVSSLFCLIPTRQQLGGRAVWISAMIKSVSDSSAPPPEVTLVLRSTGADGKRSEVSATCPGTGEWAEVTLLATMPEYAGDATDVPPFHVLFFERPPGVGGRVFIDDVVMLGIPEGRFDGGLAPTPAAR